MELIESSIPEPAVRLSAHCAIPPVCVPAGGKSKRCKGSEKHMCRQRFKG